VKRNWSTFCLLLETRRTPFVFPFFRLKSEPFVSWHPRRDRSGRASTLVVKTQSSDALQPSRSLDHRSRC
jgi:hypothetical protein